MSERQCGSSCVALSLRGFDNNKLYHSLTRSLTHSRTHARTHSRTHARTHSLTHSCGLLLTHSLTHSRRMVNFTLTHLHFLPSLVSHFTHTASAQTFSLTSHSLSGTDFLTHTHSGTDFLAHTHREQRRGQRSRQQAFLLSVRKGERPRGRRSYSLDTGWEVKATSRQHKHNTLFRLTRSRVVLLVARKVRVNDSVGVRAD